MTASTARDLLVVEGADATDFLQGQCSQDLAAVAVGASAWTFVLEPQGHVSAWFRATRTESGWLLDVDAGHGEAAEARIRRFMLRVDVTISRSTEPLWCVEQAAGDHITDAVIIAPSLVDGYVDVIGNGAIDGALTPEVYERLRIAAGVPTHAAEIGDKTIPAELGVVAMSVSFTKGCYTGQELVARVDSRGDNTPRRLRIVRGSGPLPTPGAEVREAEAGVGYITSVAADGPGWVALSSVTRAGQDLTTASLEDGQAVELEVSPLEERTR